MSKHIKTISLRKEGREYALEIDAEDQNNLVLESVTLIKALHPRDNEKEIDPTDFEDDLDDDDWAAI
jgi:hypothetical protein